MDIEKILEQLTLEEKASLCSGADFWHTKAIQRLGIPSIMMCDGPNGLRKQQEKTDNLGINPSIPAVCFPTASAMAASFDVELIESIGQTIGEEYRAEDVAMVLGPGANIKRSPLCGRNFEYFSEDPYLSSQMASAYIKGVQSRNVAVCLKHFACNNQETRRINGNSIVDERTLNEIYLASFESAVKDAHPVGVMCSYNKINGTYSAENKSLLSDILREKWGFDGIVITDWGAVKDRVDGLIAGLDLQMPGGTESQENDRKIIEAVKSGKLAIEQLDKAVRNLLKFIDFYSAGTKRCNFDRKIDYEKAKNVAKECAVLLKNNGCLPLVKSQKVALIGEFVNKPRYQGGGSSHINSNYVPSVLSVLSNSNTFYSQGYTLGNDATDGELLELAIKTSAESDIIVVFAGLPERYEIESVDRKSLELPQNQNELITELCKLGKDVVVVLHNGAPVTMPWIDKVSAVLEMYLGGDGVSEATISLLYGESNPCGKLAESFPLKLEDNPSYINFPGEYGTTEYREGVFVGYRYYDKKKMDVLFPFGHGLSYTSFEYSNLILSKEKITDKDKLTISVTVKNVGTRSGKEVVQLYVGEIDSKRIRPVRELRGFKKIELDVGQSTTVNFVLNKRDFAYYETALHDFTAPSNIYEIAIGASSRDIRLTKTVKVESTDSLPMKVSYETSLADLKEHPKTKSYINEMMMRIMKATGVIDGELSDKDYGMGEGEKGILEAIVSEMTLGGLAGHIGQNQDQLADLIMTLQSMIDGQEG